MTDRPLVPDAEPLAVRDEADVRACFPEGMVDDAEDRPVTDGLVAGLTELALEYQYRADLGCAQGDPLRASDQYLDGIAEDRDGARALDESDETLRVRIFETPEVVTPAAIVDAVNRVLESYGVSAECELFDGVLDRWFLNNGTTSWHSFIGRSPFYPERYFGSDLVSNGIALENNDPDGAWVFADALGRIFVLRVPDLSPLNDSPAFVFDGSGEVPVELSSGFGSYVGNGAGPPQTMFINAGTTLALTAYQGIVEVVERIIGHSIRWILWADPEL